MEPRPIDAIDRNRLLGIVLEHLRGMKPDGAYKKGFINAMCIVKSTLKDRNQTPTLDYAPVRHGEWVDEINPNAVTTSGREVHVWRCSVCGFTWANKHDVLHYFKHCPNCGAKIKGVEKHD